MKKKWIKEQISSLSSLRTDEHHTWVNLFSACLATSALLLIALFSNGENPQRIQGIVICSFGALVSMVYLRIQNRALISMKGYEKAIEEIENELGLKSPRKFIKNAKFLGGRPTMTLFTTIQLIGWIAGDILFIFCK